MSSLTRPDGAPIRVLVVDDEDALAGLLASALKYEGWEIRTASDGRQGLREVGAFDPDIVLLDVMMPGLDGFGVLDRLRAEGNTVPVLFLTARDEVDDRVRALRSGADDYVVKPYSLEEVVARITALLRRAGAARPAERVASIIEIGELRINEDSHEVSVAGEPVQLSATEYNLLHYLASNQGRVLSKEQILDAVWGYDFGGRSNVVELYISYLRKKLEGSSAPLIHTLRGAGYMLKAGARR